MILAARDASFIQLILFAAFALFGLLGKALRKKEEPDIEEVPTPASPPVVPKVRRAGVPSKRPELRSIASQIAPPKAASPAKQDVTPKSRPRPVASDAEESAASIAKLQATRTVASQAGWRRGVVLAEILGPPVAFREPRDQLTA